MEDDTGTSAASASCSQSAYKLEDVFHPELERARNQVTTYGSSPAKPRHVTPASRACGAVRPSAAYDGPRTACGAAGRLRRFVAH